MQKIPRKGEFLDILLRSSRTIFSTQDAALLWNEGNRSVITDRLKKYVRAGKLIRPYHGFYAKDERYNRFELATRIYTPSYISFETVLTRAGVSFQFYSTIFVASYVTRDITAGDQNISFIRMKEYVLSNTAGIQHPDGVATATKERAFLDRISISKDYHFDNVSALDWDMVFELLPIYHNKRMEKRVHDYGRHFKDDQPT